MGEKGSVMAINEELPDNDLQQEEDMRQASYEHRAWIW